MNKIVTCLDSLKTIDAVNQGAIWAAKKLQKPLLLMHVIERKNNPASEDLSGAIGLGARSTLLTEMAETDAANSKAAIEEGKQLLDRSIEKTMQHGCQGVEQLQRHGSWLENINELGAQTHMLIIGHSETKTEEHFQTLETYITPIIRQLQVPMLITHDQFSEPSNFMLAYDGSKSMDQALLSMLESGLLNNLTCHLVTVKNNDKKQHEQFIMAQELLQKHSIKVISSYLEGSILESLIAYKAEHSINMLVMGAFSHSSLWQMFFGSTTLRVLQNTDLPLLILR